MLIKEIKVFHSRNLLNDSGPWNLSVNPFQTKFFKQSNYFSSNIGYALKKTQSDCC